MKKLMMIMILSVRVLNGMSMEEAIAKFAAYCNPIIQQQIQGSPTTMGKQDIICTYLRNEKGLIQGTENLSWIMQATINEDERLVEALLVLGADPTIKNRYNETPLYIAASNGSEAIVKMLLENGAAINECDKNERFRQVTNPLIGAVFCGQAHIVKLLLQENANPDVKDYDGRTILEIAQEEAEQSTDQYLYCMNNDHEEFMEIISDEAQETLKVVQDYYAQN